MDTEALTRPIHADRKAGLVPFVAIVSCGTTNTGSVDPFGDIADICRQEDIWVHVDGAYGASACLSTSRGPVMMNGIDNVDSISWDAHKWLFQTYGCGVILVRDRKCLLGSFLTDAEYLRDATEEDDVPNFWNYGIELTRPARAMKLWFTFQVLGVDMIGRMIDHGFYLADRVEEQLRGLPDWEVTSSASMAIVTFRFKPVDKAESELDILNATISKRVIAENVAGILTTKLNGKIVLRICAINPWISGSEMEKVFEMVDQLARRILAESQ